MKILILSPHTDDAELGCGGVMNKYDCDVIVFSTCKESNKGYDLEKECRDSLATYGIDPTILDFPVRRFNEHRQQILDVLYPVQYDLVLCPSKNDKHQDHQVIYQEAMRAFDSVMGYELPWNTNDFNPNLTISLDRHDIERKCIALSNYKSQSNRAYFDVDYIFSWAKYRGLEGYAEGFEVYKWLL